MFLLSELGCSTFAYASSRRRSVTPVTGMIRSQHLKENYINPEGIGLRGVLTENNPNLSSLNFKFSARRRAQVESGRYYEVLLQMNRGHYVIARKTLFASPHRLLFHSNRRKSQYAFIINEAGEIEFDENIFIVAWNNKSGSYQFATQYNSDTNSIDFLQQPIDLGFPSDSFSAIQLS